MWGSTIIKSNGHDVKHNIYAKCNCKNNGNLHRDTQTYIRDLVKIICHPQGQKIKFVVLRILE